VMRMQTNVDVSDIRSHRMWQPTVGFVTFDVEISFGNFISRVFLIYYFLIVFILWIVDLFPLVSKECECLCGVYFIYNFSIFCLFFVVRRLLVCHLEVALLVPLQKHGVMELLCSAGIFCMKRDSWYYWCIFSRCTSCYDYLQLNEVCVRCTWYVYLQDDILRFSKNFHIGTVYYDPVPLFDLILFTNLIII
jgi:hypothetical protein